MILIPVTNMEPLYDSLTFNFGPETGGRLYKVIVDRIGYDPGEALGYGSFGTAYSLIGTDRKILKITGDMSEMEVMSALPDHPNLAEVYDAFVVKLPSVTITGEEQGIGVLVKERVDETLTQNAPMDVKRAIAGAREVARDILDSRLDRGDSPQLAAEDAMQHFLVELEIWRDALRSKKKSRAIVDGVFAGLEALYDEGIYTIDAHLSNLGIIHGRPNRVVFFDIGAASTDADHKVELPVLANPGVLGTPELPIVFTW